MNDRLLAWFQERPNEYISGEEISRELQISRTAVWKHINRLRAKGFDFEATPKLGYRLVQQPTRLDEISLLSKLKTERFGRQVRVLSRTDSTQNEALAWAQDGTEEGALVIAEEQVSGRGRQGRSWFSPPGKGIWMSMVMKPRIPLQFTPHLTLLTAVAVCRAIKRVVNVPIGIKWPNDLLIENRKVCGILLESSAEDERLVNVIAGIGIDVNIDERDYPEHLLDIATSLKREAGHEIDRATLLAEILLEWEQLYKLYEEQGFGPIRTIWEANSVMIGRHVQLKTPYGEAAGTAQGLDESGALVLLGPEGLYQKVFSGDVRFTDEN
ncbi:biotin--[acetyl-CoA-carboxylase] ligase [Paenibacillus marinisediminis]